MKLKAGFEPFAAAINKGIEKLETYRSRTALALAYTLAMCMFVHSFVAFL